MKQSLILQQTPRSTSLKYCILCCGVCCTELQLRKCLISCACFADTKTARSVAASAHAYASLFTGFSTRYCCTDIDLCDIRKAAVLNNGRLQLNAFLRDLQADSIRATLRAGAACCCSFRRCLSSEETFISCNTCSIICF